jgi:hypothetical protein
VIAGGVIAHKTVEVACKIKLSHYVEDDSSLTGSSVITVKVTEGDKYVSLLVRSIDKVSNNT